MTTIKLDKTILSLEKRQTATITVLVGPENAIEKAIEWSTGDNTIATVNELGEVKAVAKGATTITVTAKDGSGVSATCNVSVYSYDAPDAIDLGLSVKWAIFNVGASSPEEAGVYFSWAENSPKEDYSWPYYKWCYGTDNTISKYNTREASGIVDGKTTLDMEDNVAREKLGEPFRIPSHIIHSTR